jgi:tetratricopeptide (TPR) repeat protein
LAFWPIHLGPLYDFTYVDRVSSLRFILPMAAMVVCLLVLWRCSGKPKSRAWAFCGLWFFITLAPAMAQFCLAEATQSYHDRYLYLPGVGLAMLIGAMVSKLTWKGIPGNLIAYGVVAAVTVVLALSTLRQVRYWESNYTLFERASAVAPNNDLAAGNFTVELIKRKEYRRALDLSETMIRLHPASERPLQAAARASFLLHDFVKAEHYYTEAARLDPSEPNLWLALGSAQMKLGRYSEAADSLQKAVTLDPQAPLVHYSLGFALAQLHNWQAARQQFLAELQINCECSSSVTRRALQDVDSHLIARAVPSVWKSSGDGTVVVPVRHPTD